MPVTYVNYFTKTKKKNNTFIYRKQGMIVDDITYFKYSNKTNKKVRILIIKMEGRINPALCNIINLKMQTTCE